MLSSVMGPLLSICREQHTDLSTSRVMLTIFIGPPQPTTQLNTIQTGHEKPCLTTREGQLILYIPHYYKSSLGPPSQIQGSFHCTRFPHTPKCSPNSSPLTPHALSPPTPYLIPLPSPSCTNLLVKSILFTPPRQINGWVPMVTQSLWKCLTNALSH